MGALWFRLFLCWGGCLGNTVEIVKADQTSFKQTCDTAWILLCRLSQNVLPFPECSDIAGWRVPFWTVFNSLLAKEDREGAYTAVAYPPVIDAKPNDMSTIFTAKNKSNKWTMPETFKDHYLYLGPFHTQCSHLVFIGKLLGSGGLWDICVDSGVYAAATRLNHYGEAIQ